MIKELFQLEPNDDNVRESFEADLYNRNHSIIRLLTALQNSKIQRSLSVSIDGSWGTGKTFFLKTIHYLINHYSENKEEIDSKITQSKLDLNLNKFSVVYYDAWMHDDENDPMISMILDVVDQTNINFEKRDITPKVKRIIKAFVKPRLDTIVDLDELDRAIEERVEIKSIRDRRDLKANIRDFFQGILEASQKEKLIILVDELDRCRPRFAISLLERIKHFCQLDNIIFIFGINKLELVNAFHQSYGEKFNCTAYLNRFFDLSVSLNQISAFQYLKIHGLEGAYYYDSRFQFGSWIADVYNLSIRDYIQFFNQMQLISLYSGDSYEGHAGEFCASIVYPLMFILRQTDIHTFNMFISGKNPQPLLDLYDRDENKIFRRVLFGYHSDENEINLADDINEIYKYLFTAPTIYKQTLRVGDAEFENWHKDWITQKCNFLLPWLDLES